ncbi:MAG: DUF3501 family protein [Alphaproteobacteria bacterium]|nr:DUF3501 family protein [Alphaproteobacteria bacterium]
MLTMEKRAITRADVMSMADYAKVRTERRRALIQTKKLRRLEIGPCACFYFESYETMWIQVHEMLRIEKGGEEQIPDELRAYNSLIPQGRELVATVMFEVDDPVQRAHLLARLGGVEDAIFISFAGETVMGRPEADIERTNDEGKTSSVHFIHFSFSPAQIEKFRAAGTQVIVGFKHADYGHMAVMPEPVRAELAKDFA